MTGRRRGRPLRTSCTIACARFGDPSTHPRLSCAAPSQASSSLGVEKSGTLSCRGGFILPDRSRHRCALEAPSLTDLNPFRVVSCRVVMCHETPAQKGAEASHSSMYAARTYRPPLETVSRKQPTSADSLVVLSIVCLLVRSAVPPPCPELIPPPLSRFHGTPVAHLGAESLLANGPFRPRNVKPHSQHHSSSRLLLCAHLGRFDPKEPTPVHTVAPYTWTADVHIPPGASGIPCPGRNTPTRSQDQRVALSTSSVPCARFVCSQISGSRALRFLLGRCAPIGDSSPV